MNVTTKITVIDHESGEVCIEWWRENEKYTLYAIPSELLFSDSTEIHDGNLQELANWVRK